MRFRSVLMVGALVLLSTADAVSGQGFQGGLRGSVKDSGGVVPGAEVTLTNDQTNIKRSTVTNERGEYAFANIDPGNFSVKVVLQGYKTVDRGDVRIGTQSFLVLDLTLEVGTIQESVTVTGQSPLIETANASQGTVIDSQMLQTLPNSGRAAFLAGVAVPTVIPSGDGQFTRQQDQSNASLLSLGGGTRRGNNYTLDGVPITDITNRAVANPNIEGLDDLKVQVHTYDAEMGRTGGGVFNTTLKSGTNNYRGSAFFQTRPVWGAANNYFAQKAFEVGGDSKNAKPATVYYYPGGSFGGPIKRDKTFFWFTTEAYHNISTRNISVLLPTAAERTGDFSGLTNATGARVTIYDPLTHLPFPNNIIPANRINGVAAAITKYLPLPQVDRDNGSANYTAAAQIVDNFQQEYSGKIEHKFNDKVALTGFYLYNRTNEPCSDYFEPGLNGPNRFADGNDYLLKRRPQILALNNTWLLSDSSVLALRFGFTRFPDNSTTTIDFDPSTLGFSPTFNSQVAQTGGPKFPQGILNGYIAPPQNVTFGAINPSYRTYKSWGTNGAFSKFVGTHTFKMGADFRKIGVYLLNPGNASGQFQFDKEFTSSTGLNNASTTDGNSFASFLLGYPTADAARQSTMTLTTPFEIYTNYFGGYWQDDWRVSSKLTLNYGLRVEHEDGIREVDNNFTVGFDRGATSALSGVVIPASVDPTGATAPRAVTGGLMYAGVDGNNTYQGNPPRAKWSPRVGAVYSITPSTVLRGGYGLYWAPWNYPVPSSVTSNYGQIGFTNNTVVPQTPTTPTVTLTNPFPNGLVAPSGNSLGALSGVGTSISFVDQGRTAPRVQQYSADLQHELPNSMAITISYIGARGDHLPLGGTIDTAVNINQLDPKYAALGAAALSQQVPNPFFGVAAAGPLSASAMLSRAQLLRPFPQFLNISDRQISEGVNRYHAVVVEWTKRPSRGGLGGRASYTYSVLKDNQIGETNFYTNNGNGIPLNNYNYIASMPACTTTNNAACFNPLAEYQNGVLDVPHRVIISPVWQLPSPARTSGIANLLAAGWTAAAVINIQSGFPIGVAQSDNLGLLGNAQRPNTVDGVDRGTPGDLADRLASADHPTSAWVNPAAFTTASPGTWGNAPRLITDVRTPRLVNTDVSVSKNVSLNGGKAVQIKIEMINLLNRVQTNSLSSVSVGSASFGQINSQSGFMRLTQVMFRFSF
jgi:trimeric autotransporter adhesin